jgi:hypothetical protein
MNIKSSEEKFNSSEGLKIAFLEVEKIKRIIYDTVERIHNNAPNYRITLRDNKKHITDILFKDKTLTVQFYEGIANQAKSSYLFLAFVNGYFREDGTVDPFYPVTLIELIRLDFTFNEKGEFGWRNQENSSEFFSSEEIIAIWLKKFFNLTLDE